MRGNMETITHDFLVKEFKSKRAISALSIFALCGFVVPIIPFMVLKELNTNSLISFAFLMLVFGIPFGYLIGLKNIIKTSRIHSDLENKRFTILIDEIADMMVTKNGRASEMDDSFCELRLRRYSAKKKVTIAISASKFGKLKIGDQCILIFANSEKKPVLVFAGNEYCIDEQLKSYLV